ncbi:MAG TPA: hypothetical protein VFT04_00350 [Gemmatimonadales bacterium]|nr:hypothetical protein [Gemmatimonadales bacterium]
MTRSVNPHLSSDDFDALLEGAASQDAQAHLAACALCRDQVAADRTVVTRLESLSSFAPSADFPGQVMARVVIPDPFALHSFGSARRKVFATRRSLAAAASVAIIVVGAMAASVIWTVGNRETLAAAGSWLGGEAVSWLWIAVRGGAANLMEQPWYAAARGFLGSPTRLAILSAAVSTLYLGGLFALRRLMTLPARGGTHAHA